MIGAGTGWLWLDAVLALFWGLSRLFADGILPTPLLEGVRQYLLLWSLGSVVVAALAGALLAATAGKREAGLAHSGSKFRGAFAMVGVGPGAGDGEGGPGSATRRVCGGAGCAREGVRWRPV